jgi:biopolymer transport protein ExbD
MRIKRGQREPVEIFTNSMADVSFLLVIFFIVTSVLTASRGLDLALPEPVPDDEEVEFDESVDVHVLTNGSIEVDGRPMQISNLLPYIAPRLEADPLKPVILRTDEGATYAAMISVLDELRMAPQKVGFEIENLAIPTLREQGAW